VTLVAGKDNGGSGGQLTCVYRPGIMAQSFAVLTA